MDIFVICTKEVSLTAYSISGFTLQDLRGIHFVLTVSYNVACLFRT